MENINPLITQHEVDLLNDYLKDLSDELVMYAIKEAVEHNARSMKYIKSILDRCINQRITTLEQLKKLENIKKNKKESKNNFQNYEQRNPEDIDFNSFYAN